MFTMFLSRFRPDDPVDLHAPPRPPWPGGPIRGWSELMERFPGRSFNGGLYRLHSAKTGARADSLVAEALPWIASIAYCFGYDWLGRQFALETDRREGVGGEPHVLIVDWSTGEVYRIPATFADFHDVMLTEKADVILSADLFEPWSRTQSHLLPLAPNQVVGYKIPLALGGEHALDNLELGYLEVEVGFAAQIAEQTADLAEGTPVTGVRVEEEE